MDPRNKFSSIQAEAAKRQFVVLNTQEKCPNRDLLALSLRLIGINPKCLSELVNFCGFKKNLCIFPGVNSFSSDSMCFRISLALGLAISQAKAYTSFNGSKESLYVILTALERVKLADSNYSNLFYGRKNLRRWRRIFHLRKRKVSDQEVIIQVKAIAGQLDRVIWKTCPNRPNEQKLKGDKTPIKVRVQGGKQGVDGQFMTSALAFQQDIAQKTVI